MAARAVVPASAVQPDVDSRVMESVSDLILEMKLTVRPRGASKDTEAYTRAETTEMIETAMMMRNEMVVLPVTTARLFLLAGLSEGKQKMGMGRTRKASGNWIRRKGCEGVVQKAPLGGGPREQHRDRTRHAKPTGVHAGAVHS